jgi:hypothetical protein
MTLNEEVDEIEQELSLLSARLDRFERRAKETINVDRDVMLDRLRDGVRSVEQTVSLLELPPGGAIRLLAYGKEVLFPARELSVAQVEERAQHMHGSFRLLRTAADTGLDNVKKINLERYDLDAELDSIRVRLKAVTDRARRSLDSAKEAKIAKEEDLVRATASCDESRRKLASLQRDMEERKDNRNVMRVVGY